MRLDYLQHRVRVGEGADLAPGAAVIGRLVAGAGLVLRPFATLRADGESITVGRDAFFGERASVHIVDGILATRMGDDVTVGRFGLVHACTVGDGCVVGEAAAVLDGATLGDTPCSPPTASWRRASTCRAAGCTPVRPRVPCAR